MIIDLTKDEQHLRSGVNFNNAGEGTIALWVVYPDKHVLDKPHFRLLMTRHQRDQLIRMLSEADTMQVPSEYAL